MSLGSRLRLHGRSPLNQLKFILLLFIILTIIGIFFYRFVLGWTLQNAILQVVLTVSTLGGEAKRGGLTSSVAAWFNIFYILTILFTALWGISILIEAMVRGDLLYYWGTRRMEQRIAHVKNHYLICGFGRMGQEIARQFMRTQQSFVVVEHNPVQLPALENSGYLYVKGDAREDEELLRAGIKHAKGLVAVASTDEENVYITLSARVLNPDLFIVTRCSQTSGEAKLLHAGANRVFSPYIIGGRRMAQAVLRPSVVDFLDTIIHDEQIALLLEEVTMTTESPITGQPMHGEVDIEQLGVHLLGISTHDGSMLMSNLDKHVIEIGDTLILLGEPTAMQKAIKKLNGLQKELSTDAFYKPTPASDARK